jgi:hypothetical protein
LVDVYSSIAAQFLDRVAELDLLRMMQSLESLNHLNVLGATDLWIELAALPQFPKGGRHILKFGSQKLKPDPMVLCHFRDCLGRHLFEFGGVLHALLVIRLKIYLEQVSLAALSTSLFFPPLAENMNYLTVIGPALLRLIPELRVNRPEFAAAGFANLPQRPAKLAARPIVEIHFHLNELLLLCDLLRITRLSTLVL